MTYRALSGHFVESAKGDLFVTLWRPPVPHKRCVLFVPAFAEEMNKSRRMMAICAQNLLARGMASVICDLYGTGDSTGDFRDADWQTWCRDLHVVSEWISGQSLELDTIVAVRLGAELAAQALETRDLPRPSRTVLWNPIFDANRFLTQFLRLRIAASAMQRESKETVASLKQRFKLGETIQVAGYPLSARLANDLEIIPVRKRVPDQFGAVTWIETQRDGAAPLGEVAKGILDASIKDGCSVSSKIVQGDPYWSASEIIVNAKVIELTVEAVT